MEKLEIKHSYVQVRGLNLHVAETGTGHKVVLFLHGFPEIWYSWRHQMVAVANNGYRAIAIDFRGYGLSDHPAEPEKGSIDDLLDDVVSVLDSFNINKIIVAADFILPSEFIDPPSTISQHINSIWVFVVGKDFGAAPTFQLAVIHPERVAGMVTLGIPFLLPGPSAIRTDLLPRGFYVIRWHEPERAEADFGRFDVKTVIRRIYILFCRSELQVADDDQEILDLVGPSSPLPPWLSEEDLNVYASLYEKSGFRTALQIPYRSLGLSYGLTDPKITAPSLLIMGEKDYFMKFPGMEDYMRSGFVKQFVPNLEITFMPEGNHFVQEQLPEQVNQLLIDFLKKHDI